MTQHLMSIVYPHIVDGVKPRMRSERTYNVLEKTDVALKDISKGNNIKLVAEISKDIEADKFTYKMENILVDNKEKENDVFSYYCDNDNNFYFTTSSMTVENIEKFLDNTRVKPYSHLTNFLTNLNQKNKKTFHDGEEISDFGELRQINKERINESREFVKEIFGNLYVDGNKILIPCKEPRFFIKYKSSTNYSNDISFKNTILYPFHKYEDCDIDHFHSNSYLKNNTLPLIYKNLFFERMNKDSQYKDFISYYEKNANNLVYSIIEPEFFIINPNEAIAENILKGSVFDIKFNEMDDELYEKLKEFKIFLNSVKDYGVTDDMSKTFETYFQDLKTLYSPTPSYKSDRMFSNFENLIKEYKEIMRINYDAINHPEKFIDNKNDSLKLSH